MSQTIDAASGSPGDTVIEASKGYWVQAARDGEYSGPIEIGDRTSLVGRNESGKTNLLRALEALNPPGGLTELTFAKDFPRDRLRSDFKPDLTLSETTWQLSDDEAAELGEVFPRADGVASVTVGRQYAPTRWVRFEGLPPLEVPVNDAARMLTGLQSSVSGSNFGVTVVRMMRSTFV